MKMLALGVDVSLARGLDVVALDQTLTPVLARRRQTLDQLASIVRELSPGVIAIDSPPAWAREGRSRALERQLAGYGIHIFATPSDPAGSAFYDWMEVGFKVFAEASALGYPVFAGIGSPRHTSIEVFPHASAVVLRGSLPAARSPKRIWRREVLAGQGVKHEQLATLDQLDAALAALTGIRTLEGGASWVGIPGEAVLVLPVARLPQARFARDQSPTQAPRADGSRVRPGLVTHEPRA